MLQIVIQLNRLPSKDPHFHLKCFLEASDAFMITRASKEALGLTLFPFYLRDQVKALLNSLLFDSIIIWNDLVEIFLMKYFLPTKNTKLSNKITSFHQLEDKSLYDAWERFKKLFKRCPYHGIHCCI